MPSSWWDSRPRTGAPTQARDAGLETSLKTSQTRHGSHGICGMFFPWLIFQHLSTKYWDHIGTFPFSNRINRVLSWFYSVLLHKRSFFDPNCYGNGAGTGINMGSAWTTAKLGGTKCPVLKFPDFFDVVWVIHVFSPRKHDLQMDT